MAKKKEVKFKIDSYNDRRDLCAILADNGYKVTVKEKKEFFYSSDSDFYVVVEVD